MKFFRISLPLLREASAGGLLDEILRFNENMDRARVIAILRQHEPELKASGVLSMSLFGSVARDDAGPDSDIDVVVQIGENFSNGGFDYFWQLKRLEQRLSQLFGRKVDIVREPVRKTRFQNEIDRDRAFAF